MGTGVRLDGSAPLRSQNGYVILFDANSHNQESPVITIRDTPIVITAFGLLPGETITVYAIHTWLGITYSQPFNYLGVPIVLDSENSSQKLGINGTYKLVFDGVLGDLVCISVAQSLQDARRRSYKPDSQPYGDQVNRPNVYFDVRSDSNISQIAEILDTPWVFNAYDIPNGEEVTVYGVHGYGVDEISEPYLYNGEELKLTGQINAILLDKSGRYRFVYTGVPGAILLVGMPMGISYDDPQSRGPQGPQGATGEKGDKGDKGDTGNTGAAGAPGSVWRSGAGAPSNGLGINGDYYLNTTNDDVYLKTAGVYSVVTNIKGSQGIQGIQGIPGTNGTNGTNGSTWRSGAGAPSNGLGADGDYYLNTTNSDVYLKTAGVYVVVTNIKGATGATGAAGVVQSIVAGTNVTIDNTDPANPIVNSSGSGSGIPIGLVLQLPYTPVTL